MYLVMTKEKPNQGEIVLSRQVLNALQAIHSYDGESTQRIKDNLLKEDKNCVVVSADSRFMYFVGKGKPFSLDEVYILENNQLTRLRDTTIRILREGHNLMKLYESGEFH